MKEWRSQTGRGHGPEGDAALLLVEGEELQVELAGGGQHVVRVGVDPAVGRDQGQGTPLAAGRVRDTGGGPDGPSSERQAGKRLLSFRIRLRLSESENNI